MSFCLNETGIQNDLFHATTVNSYNSHNLVQLMKKNEVIRPFSICYLKVPPIINSRCVCTRKVWLSFLNWHMDAMKTNSVASQYITQPLWEISKMWWRVLVTQFGNVPSFLFSYYSDISKLSQVGKFQVLEDNMKYICICCGESIRCLTIKELMRFPRCTFEELLLE